METSMLVGGFVRFLAAAVSNSEVTGSCPEGPVSMNRPVRGHGRTADTHRLVPRRSPYSMNVDMVAG
jgi:hypothetical protein